MLRRITLCDIVERALMVWFVLLGTFSLWISGVDVPWWLVVAGVIIALVCGIH